MAQAVNLRQVLLFFFGGGKVVKAASEETTPNLSKFCKHRMDDAHNPTGKQLQLQHLDLILRWLARPQILNSNLPFLKLRGKASENQWLGD